MIITNKVFKEANQQAVEAMKTAQPVLVDIEPASKVISGMKKDLILHAGPPVEWDQMCGPLRGAVLGALVYEEIANSPSEAEAIIESGKIEFAPCHERNAVGPMTGVVSSSMPMFVVENTAQGNRSYSTINEGLGKVLRFGAFDEEVIMKLKWIENTLGPSLKQAVRRADGINLNNIISRALHMGDECHNRNIASTSLFSRMLMPILLDSNLETSLLQQISVFLAENDHFFLNLSMAACKATMDAAHGNDNSTIVTAMSRNGTEFGIRVSTFGDEWFTAPASTVEGLYFPGYTAEDANPDIGDSSITETRGLGGFAMAASPAIVRFVGGTPADAIAYTREMREITIAADENFTIPALGFEGIPTGIDLLKVIDTGILPIINTGIAHRKPGVGQIGAGVVRPPMECFKKALVSLSQRA
ncbi:MAG: DUF1116 domain-containing protein [Candidatus Thorarchaeota archaeon]